MNNTLSRRSSSIVPSMLRSGTAPRGSASSNVTSTVRVPPCTDGSMRTTRAAHDAVVRVDGGTLPE